MAEPISNPVVQDPTPGTGGEVTFTQAEVDALISKEKWERLTGEREALSGKLTAAENERDQLKRDLYVLKKGLSGEEAEFIAFKALKMVDDKTTFEQAVDSLTADRKKTTFDWTAPVGDGSKKTSENDVMNALLRGALK